MSAQKRKKRRNYINLMKLRGFRLPNFFATFKWDFLAIICNNCHVDKEYYINLNAKRIRVKRKS